MPADRDDQVVLLLTELVVLNRKILLALSPDGAPVLPNSSTRVAASDTELDSQYGDPQVKVKDPRRWSGPTMRGRKFSECPPEYLDLLAELFDWQGDEAEKKRELTSNNKPVAPFRRKDAARARGWAARIRAGAVHQAPIGPVEQPNYSPDPSFADAGDYTPSNFR